jgi:hypothetical protein
MKGTLHEDQYIFLSYLAHFFLEWGMIQIKNVEEIKIGILYLVTFFSKIMLYIKKSWKNFFERGRPQMTIWRMRIECYTPKATNTHIQVV